MFFAANPSELATKDEVLSLSGLDYMRAMLDGKTAAPPIAKLMNYRIDTVEDGRITLVGTPQFDHLNPAGGVHGGWYGTVLDTVMACAVVTRLPRGTTYTTLEYKVNLIRAIPSGTRIRGIGLADHVGRSTGVAHGEIRGVADDRLYATGSTTCLVMKIRD